MTAMNSEQAQVASSIDSLRSPKSGSVLLKATGLCKSFGGQTVLNNVDVEICEGEVILVRGDNGSGKTTALDILTGNLAPDAGTLHFFTDGHEEIIHFPRCWWQDLNPFNHFTPEWVARKGRVGREWQDIRLFNSQTLCDNVAVAAPEHPGENPVSILFRGSAVRNHELRVASDASNVLAKLGMQGRETSSADKVSLGQAKRVAIARAVQAGAKILCLDEALSGLDSAGIEEVLRMLKDLANNQRLTLVIVEHVFNAERILEFATSVWTLKNGALSVESPAAAKARLSGSQGGTVAYIEKRLAPYTEIRRTPILNDAEFVVFSRKKGTVEAPLLEVNNLVVYRGNRLVVGTIQNGGKPDGISFKLYRGEVALLVAANGQGKTTIAEALAGIVAIASGQILFDGVPIERMSIWERASRGLVFLQARNHVFPNLSVKETLRLAGLNTPSPGLMRLLHRRVSQLSGGEKGALAFECAVHRKDYRLAVLDETFSNLDETNTEALFEHVKNVEDRAFLICLPDQKGKTI
jgi:ABC-type branched-subunit amino acid transport system ATPase component